MVEINDSHGMYSTGSQIRLKTSMLRSCLCDYSDASILVRGTITTTAEGADDDTKRTNEGNKGVMFKNCAPFIGRTSEINNNQIDYAKDLDDVMSMYDLKEYSKVSQL